MFYWTGLCYFVVALFLAASAVDAHGWERWQVLDEAALTTALEHPPILVAFFEEEEDRKVFPLELEAGSLDNGFDVKLFAHQCTPESRLCGGIAKDQLPRVVYYDKKGDAHIYRGPRKAAEISMFIDRMDDPIVHEFDAVAGLLELDQVVCLCKASSSAHQDFIAAFEQVAATYRDEYTFVFKEQAQGAPPLVECRRWREPEGPPIREPEAKTYTGRPDGIEGFVLEASRPKIAYLTHRNHQRLLDRQWPMVYIFGETGVQRTTLRLDIVHDFANSYPDLSIVIVDPLDFPDLPAKLGLEDKDKRVQYPAGAVHQLTTGKIWAYPRGRVWDKDSLSKWGMDVWSGKVKPWNQPDGKGKGGGKKMGQKTIKSNRQIKLPNVPGLEKLRAKLEGRDEL